ncbi:MAG TPA: hypothetical protein VHE30_10350 [Polyangiaceae bacterium]|nr:hypothetical protein [Polyangiaceae bacterium]
MPSFLEANTRRGLEATAEALFPGNDYGAPDHRDTELVARTLTYLDALPGPQRRLIQSLFALVELGAPLLGLGASRFSSLSAPAREAGIRRLRRSRFLPYRLVGDALKATLTLLYMSHPKALAHIGAYSVCERPADPFRIPVRAGALERGAP